MDRPTLTIVLLVLLLAVVLPGICTGGETPDWAHPDVMKIPVVLPEVRGTDEPRDAHVFLAVLEANGNVTYADGARLAATSHDRRALVGTSRLVRDDLAVNARSLRDVGKAMVEAAVSSQVPRDAGGQSSMRLLLRAHRDAPWAYALWLMMKGVAPRVGVGRILFAVHGDGHPVVGHDLPRDRGTPSHAARRVVRVEIGPRPDMEKAALVHTGGPSEHVIDLRKADAPKALVHLLDALQEENPGLIVELGLTPAGQRIVSVGDVLPLLAAIQSWGLEVHLRAIPLGRLTELDDEDPRSLPPTMRSPFLTAPTRPTSVRDEVKRAQAIDQALTWLAAHQSPSGGWEAAGFAQWCNGERLEKEKRPDGMGDPAFDRGVTGLALLAFLGAGHTHKVEGKFAKTVSRGLQYLNARQDDEGCFSPRDTGQYIYNHGAATWAMVEAYGMTGSPLLRASAQRGLDFIALARNPYFAWRYGVKPGDNDTSVTAWMTMPLAAARIVNEDAKARGRSAPLTIDPAAFDGVRAWLQKMTDPDYGRIGYIQRGGGPARPQALVDRYPGDKSESLTGVGITLGAFIGVDPSRNALALKGVRLMQNLPPRWNPTAGSIDMYYWFWGTMAMHQVGGRTWRRWSKTVDETLVPNQRKDTTVSLYRGSWDPIGPWGTRGGRVYATAICCLTLETSGRYDRVHRR